MRKFQYLFHYYSEAETVGRATTSTQTTQELSNSKPRKNKQKKIIKSQRQKIKRLTSAQNKIPCGKKAQQEKALEDALQELPENLCAWTRYQSKPIYFTVYLLIRSLAWKIMEVVTEPTK